MTHSDLQFSAANGLLIMATTYQRQNLVHDPTFLVRDCTPKLKQCDQNHDPQVFHHDAHDIDYYVI
eukprot:1503611-Amphidinium_carterae.1